MLISIQEYVKLASPEPEVPDHRRRITAKWNKHAECAPDRWDYQGQAQTEEEAAMIPLRLVLDTDVLVSAALKPNDLERTAFILAIPKPARLYISQAILEEYRDVHGRAELKIRKGARRQLLQLIRNRSYTVKPSRRIDVTGDADDHKFLECADAARADYLITGNRRHFPRHWKKTKVITTRALVELMTPHLMG